MNTYFGQNYGYCISKLREGNELSEFGSFDTGFALFVTFFEPLLWCVGKSPTYFSRVLYDQLLCRDCGG